MWGTIVGIVSNMTKKETLPTYQIYMKNEMNRKKEVFPCTPI